VSAAAAAAAVHTALTTAAGTTVRVSKLADLHPATGPALIVGPPTLSDTLARDTFVWQVPVTVLGTSDIALDSLTDLLDTAIAGLHAAGLPVVTADPVTIQVSPDRRIPAYTLTSEV
jgi:hypothetical protein